MASTNDTGSARLSLGKRAKPSKVASSDPTRPVLQHAHVYQRNGHREIALTDTYRLVSIPVDDDVPLGAVNIEALKRIELGQKHKLTATGVEVEAKQTRQPVVYPAPNLGDAPNFGQLFEVEGKPDEAVVRIGLNAALLKGLAEALGTDAVCLEIRVLNGTTMRPMRVTSEPHTRSRGEGLLMPVRVDRS